MNYLLGIDAGTTSFKGALFDENGNMVASAAKSYSLIESVNSFVEFDAEDYWNIFKEVIGEILSKSAVRPAFIKAVAIDSQGETIIPVDKKGKALHNAIVWLDNRAVKQADSIKQQFGVKSVYEHTGQPEVTATWPASKILWIRENRPDIFKKTFKFLMLEDYLIFRLTGKYICEKTLLSSTIYLDINKGHWWREMLNFIGIAEENLPEIMDSAQCVGELSENAAKETGLYKETIIVTGALDQVAGMIGAGNTGGDIITETTGTCLGVCINTDNIPEYKKNVNIPCHVHVIPHKYFLILWSQTAGSVLEWFHNNFCDRNSGYKVLDKQAGMVPPASEGLLMLPHLNGMACPDFNPNAKGVFYGVRSVHTKGHFSRSIMESVAYMLKEHIEVCEKAGIKTGQIRSLGGGARSKLWNSIKADVLGREIVTLESKETTCLGAAILAGTGIGLFESIEKACERLVKTKDIFKPDPANKHIYQKSYDAYKKLYQSLKEMYGYY